MSLIIITPPATEPIGLEEAKLHLKATEPEDDSLIFSYIVAAREYAESFQHRALITQTLELVLDEFPEEDQIELPRPPLQSVTSIKYTDKDGTETTMPSTDYIVDTAGERVVLGYGKSWPSVTLRPAAAVRIRYVAGYTNEAAVPEKTKQAMRMLIAHLYENREAVIDRTLVNVPMGVDAFLWFERSF